MRNFHHSHLIGLALAPQSVNNAVVNGAAIAEPWSLGRLLSFILIGGAFGTAATGTLIVQGLKRSDGTTWEALKDKDNATLAFPVADLADAGPLEAGAILGSVPLGRVDGITYKSVRLVYDNDVAVAVLIGAAYVISDLYAEPSGQADHLFALLHKT